jgi:hypothetical protein
MSSPDRAWRAVETLLSLKSPTRVLRYLLAATSTAVARSQLRFVIRATERVNTEGVNLSPAGEWEQGLPSSFVSDVLANECAVSVIQNYLHTDRSLHVAGVHLEIFGREAVLLIASAGPFDSAQLASLRLLARAADVQLRQLEVLVSSPIVS